MKFSTLKPKISTIKWTTSTWKYQNTNFLTNFDLRKTKCWTISTWKHQKQDFRQSWQTLNEPTSRIGKKRWKNKCHSKLNNLVTMTWRDWWSGRGVLVHNNQRGRCQASSGCCSCNRLRWNVRSRSWAASMSGPAAANVSAQRACPSPTSTRNRCVQCFTSDSHSAKLLWKMVHVLSPVVDVSLRSICMRLAKSWRERWGSAVSSVRCSWSCVAGCRAARSTPRIGCTCRCQFFFR